MREVRLRWIFQVLTCSNFSSRLLAFRDFEYDLSPHIASLELGSFSSDRLSFCEYEGLHTVANVFQDKATHMLK